MMKKILPLLFVILCVALCAIPSIGMFFAPTNERIGNETETPLPCVKTEEDGINSDYLPQLGSYFEKHFAFRPLMIDADARIQSAVFKTSNLDTVTVGSSDWLYYSSTLDNFLGRNTLSQREINGIVRNLELLQEYVESRGSRFLFTVAPNKNTLYPENMPYYDQKKASDEFNRDKLHAALSDSSVNYLDLFALFSEQDEVLYLQQDSHWNNKGALMVYNAVLDALSKEHDDYSTADVVRVKDFRGDLAKMLYPASQMTEYNYNYDINETYTYVTPTKSVEDPSIVTENSAASGSLYMYRDSFGNSLLPFFANAYGNARFTKSKPVNVALDNMNGMADAVVFEIVERNIVWFLESPPVIPSPKRVLTVGGAIEGSAQVSGSILEANAQYIALTASVDSSLCTDDCAVYLRVTDSGGKTADFETFLLPQDESGCRFVAYVPAADYADRELDIDVIVGDGGSYTKVYHASVDKIDSVI